MTRKIAIIQGHPDPGGNHFGHALAAAYKSGAESAGHTVQVIEVAMLDFPILRSRVEWEKGEAPESISQSQEVIAWADHLVLIYPLWLGTMPALMKAFLEQLLRPGFAIGKSKEGMTWEKKLNNKSARVVITMGMPAFVYRWFFRAHSLKSLERNILKFCGIGPINESIIGLVEAKDSHHRTRWLDKMQKLGWSAK